MGFIDDIEWILEHTPSERQLALFSATMPEQIKRVANQHLRILYMFVSNLPNYG